MSERVTYLLLSDFERLEDWCRMVRIIVGVTPYLVGSATERADYRDVDVRVVLDEAAFARLSRGRLDSIRFLNRALSIWGQQETGLPIDFQVQCGTETAACVSKTFSPAVVADFIVNHVLLRVLPIFGLALFGTGIATLGIPAIPAAGVAASAGLAAYVVETLGSLQSSLNQVSPPKPAAVVVAPPPAAGA